VGRKQFLLDTIKQIGEFQMQHFGSDIHFDVKTSQTDVVSFVDKQSESMFTEALHDAYPDDVVL